MLKFILTDPLCSFPPNIHIMSYHWPNLEQFDILSICNSHRIFLFLFWSLTKRFEGEIGLDYLFKLSKSTSITGRSPMLEKKLLLDERILLVLWQSIRISALTRSDGVSSSLKKMRSSDCSEQQCHLSHYRLFS